MKINLFIPYNLSILAQKKGFNEYCIGYYYKRRDNGEIHGLDTFFIDTNQNIQQWNELEEPTEAILYQQIIDWLREKHNILLGYGYYPNYNEKFACTLNFIEPKNYIKGIVYTGKTYYEALNKAIEESLKLI